MSKNRTLKLGARVFGLGQYRSGWRQSDVPSNAAISFTHHKEQVLQAEAGKFDFVFFADHVYINEGSAPRMLNRFEPLTLLSALASVTSNIGLVGTVTTSYSEPFTVARQFASLDQISGGRAAWNVVTTGLEGAAQNYGRDQHFDHSIRYQRAEEHLKVVRGLWDSWEDDAFVYDKENNVFFDQSKLHTLDHKGEYFSVKGPLNIARSEQGQPVVFQAGGSKSGRELAAKSADAIYTLPETIEEAKAFYKDIKGLAATYGREPEEIMIFPGIQPVVGKTEEEALQKYRKATAFISLEEGLQQLGFFFSGVDFSQYDPDAPFPADIVIGNSYRSLAERIVRVAGEDKLTLRETAIRFASPSLTFVGTPEKIADEIQTWFEAEAVDGFFVWPPYLEGLKDFVEQVVPVLQARGLFRTEYEHGTLRENLGLGIPANRYSV
ncbi:LLM class flavin-dependent oxidoreductase [Paenibacillus sp. NPDC058071]|uniref:LLM class flavin-dependent oxidoreductase n=1 Tax=Paenibacillus sp. NPDC058071 TaxID=3346326 RepID=UPI0036DEF46A